MNAIVVLFFLILFTPFSFADQPVHNHQGILTPYTGEPEKITLTEKETQLLQEDKPVFRKQLVGKDKRFATIFQVKASPATVWSVIRDFPHYPEWIEDIISVNIYKQEAGVFYVRFDADSKFAGENTWFARHDYPVDTREWGTWTLDYDHLSDLDDSVGYWRASPFDADPEQSIVTYSAAIQLKSKVPSFIINLILKSRLKQATTWVKQQAELRSNAQENKLECGHQCQEP